MIAFPNAKVNLGLYITEKRSDGFHNIETIFLPILKLCDILEVLPQPDQSNQVEFSVSGIEVDGNPSDNLCVKAYNILNQYVTLPKVAIHLHKQIPMGAGLGGGSADGAFTLNMLNQLSSSPLPQNELAKIALELGSDCPFFLINKPCFGKGRGDILEQIDLNLKDYHIVLVNPGIHVHTGKAYSQITPQPAPCNLRVIENIAVEKWRGMVSNDFEKVVFPAYPAIEKVKSELYAMGAVYSSMSGSGSTIFGIFKSKPDIGSRFTGMFTHISLL
jgi:4-diphosphocytidyl-2-C-methyl-D-erythritol kinase